MKDGTLSNSDAPMPQTKEQLAREKKVVQISQVQEGMKDFILKVVVVHKNVVRSWKNAKTTGRVFNFELVDAHNANKETLVDGDTI